VRSFAIGAASVALWGATLAWGLWYGARPAEPLYTPVYFTREVCYGGS
jgi:hypothetical protein